MRNEPSGERLVGGRWIKTDVRKSKHQSSDQPAPAGKLKV